MVVDDLTDACRVNLVQMAHKNLARLWYNLKKEFGTTLVQLEKRLWYNFGTI